MSKPKVFEKPIGVRDYLPHIVRRLRQLQAQVLEVMERWGYEEIMTPTLEYYDTVGAASTTSESKQFKLLDPKGKTLVLRSDMTAPIARVAASLLKDEPLPLRLSYHSNVFRAPEEEAGRDAEFFQTGVELIGDHSIDADAEVVALAIACLESSGLQQFKMALGHSGYIDGMMSDLLAGYEAEQHSLKEYLLKRNYVGFSQLLKRLPVSEAVKNSLASVLRLRGGVEVCERALELTASDKAARAIEQLREVYGVLSEYGVSDRVFVDLTMIGDFSYYTGITFEGYAVEQAFPVCSGGRYDFLLQQFGRSAPATGFALKTNRILELLGKRAEESHDESAPYKVLILYDNHRRSQAIAYAQMMRSRHGLMVETKLLADGESPLVEAEGEDCFRYNGRIYHDVITYLDGESST